MSDLEDEPRDDADDEGELSDDELDDVSGGGCYQYEPGGELNP